MLLLVDGYNVTKGDPATRDASLESQRDALVARLRVRGRDLLGSGRIVVVFDGQGGVGVTHAGAVPVEVRFSRDRSADDLLVEHAAASREKVLIVSSDRELVERVRTHAGHGAEVRGRETLFAAAAAGHKRPRSTRYPASTAGMPKGANKVTEELKKLWLTNEEE